MEEQAFIEPEFSPSIKRTWSWRHREGAVVNTSGHNTDVALELLSLEEEQKEESKGLSSRDGYQRLFEVIREELDTFSRENALGWRNDFWTSLHCRHHSSVSWMSLLFFAFEVFALVFTYASLSSERSSHVLLEGLIIFLIALFNVALCVREENLRRTETFNCTKKILDSCGDYCSWNPPDYVDPCTPSSASISLVNTYRDGELVSMPCNLLVHGDVIVLAPSQLAPASVQLLETNSSSEDTFKQDPLLLDKGQMYKPEEISKADKSEDEVYTALPCQAHPRKLFIVKEAPFKTTINHLLKSSSNKPISLLENEKHFIAGTVIEKRLLWIVISLSLVVNIVRLLLLPSSSGHWTEMVFLLQAYVILPLLPLSFPLLWTSVGLYGASRINILFEKLKDASITNVKVNKDFPVIDVLPQLQKTFLGDSSHLPRTANLLKILGNITVWCCIDRDGILSLPNPSVEKVFFLQSKKSVRQRNKSRGRKISSCTWESDISRQTSHEDNVEESSSSSSSDDEYDQMSEDGTHHKGRAAVMNVSNDPESQFGLRFDDKMWQEYLNSLKPLGLNILLNSTCSCPVRGVRFSDQAAFLSLARNSKPVHIPQRCLCLLGKEIGFTDSALNLFKKQQHIFIVHPLEFPIANFPALQSSSYLAVCKERPVPCMACLVVKEYQTGAHQLLTQGSPDLVLDTCSDFWDGSALNVISAHDKKKVLDFYQRNSIFSQCVAFAYRPCSEVPASQSDVFLKLPSVYQWNSSESIGESITGNSDNDNIKDQNGITFSTKSVGDIKMEQLIDQVNPIENAEPYHKLIGNQIFIGMVTLQYQAKKDIIPLVEDLNTAGVRFVHFSSEDELKSRVFAERMGLETGWNCHISLADTPSVQRRRSKTESSSNPATAAGDDDMHDAMHDVMHEGPDKHVSWIDLKIQESLEQVNRPEPDDHHNKTETSTLLDDEQQLESSEDYWFFYNRAKLPRGVANIRPHLENVDNVPLLVPLFTDCSPSAIQEMITIMQENGEVVCCVGSSFNVNNTSIFTQADISVSIEPMFPQLCLKGLPKDFRSGTPQLQQGEKHAEKVTFNLESDNQSSSSETDNEVSPLELSALLNSLPCSLSFHRDADFKFKSLLKEARRLSFGLRKCFTFILTCQLMLTMMMFLCQCLLLPPPLTGLHLLWLSCLTVPLLSISLIGSKSSQGLMSMMTGKNDRTFKEIAYPFCMYFSLGFLPTCVFVSVALFPLTLYGFCDKKYKSCHYLLGHRNSSRPWNGYGSTNVQALSLAQDINAFTLVLFFAIVSTSFVHHLKSLWKRSPFTNIHWVYAVISVVGLQLLYFVISQSIWTSSYGTLYTIRDVPNYVVILVFIWPLCSLIFTELVLKRRYIKLYIRFQKRAKLKFGTKLGMNSPF